MARKKREHPPPPEEARSYQEFCPPAADEGYRCTTGSASGWNLVAIVSAVLPAFASFLFLLRAADSDPEWWHWLGGFGCSWLWLWIFSFPMRTAARGTPRYQELQQLWAIWHEWLERGAAPRWKSEVEGFVGPDGEPSPVWRLRPGGDEPTGQKPFAPEQARTYEQFRCRVAYEQALCLSRPWLGPRGGNFIAWVVAVVAVILTVVFAGSVTGPDPSREGWAATVGFAAIALGALSLPVRAFRRDIPRYLQLRRLRTQWDARYGHDTTPRVESDPARRTDLEGWPT